MRIGIGFTEAGGVMLPSMMVSKADEIGRAHV